MRREGREGMINRKERKKTIEQLKVSVGPIS